MKKLIAATAAALISAGAASAATPADLNGRYGVSVIGYSTLNCTNPVIHKEITPPKSIYITVSHGALQFGGNHPIIMSMGGSFFYVKWVQAIPGGSMSYNFTFTHPGPDATLSGSSHMDGAVGNCKMHGHVGWLGRKGRRMLKP